MMVPLPVAASITASRSMTNSSGDWVMNLMIPARRTPVTAAMPGSTRSELSRSVDSINVQIPYGSKPSSAPVTRTTGELPLKPAKICRPAVNKIAVATTTIRDAISVSQLGMRLPVQITAT